MTPWTSPASYRDDIADAVAHENAEALGWATLGFAVMLGFGAGCLTVVGLAAFVGVFL